MMLSVVYLTYRPGGYDMLADGLKDQTHTDYELICIDEVTERHDIVVKYLEGKDIPISHVSPSKPKCFPELPFNLINAYNTGVLLSTGDVVILLNDYTWLPPDSLERIANRVDELGDMTAISNAAYYFSCEKGECVDHPISVWEKHWVGCPPKDGWGELWVGNPFELFYAAFPYTLLLETNGFSECYDYHMGNQIVPVVNKVREVNGKLYNDVENIAYHAGHREWGGSLWHQAKKPGQGVLIQRENCFNLKTHRRGCI